MANYKEVFTIREYSDKNTGEAKKRWVRVGSAFSNKDGSLSVHLDALPLDGKLQIRDPEEKRTNNSQRGGGSDF